jgi:hypothetical protein
MRVVSRSPCPANSIHSKIKKFDELLDYDFFIGSGNENETWNSIVGSIPNHKICKDFLYGLSSTTPVIKNDNVDEDGMVISKTVPYYIHKIYNDNNSLSNNTITPASSFLSNKGAIKA